MRKIGPGAEKNSKKGWNCIGFIRPGASGPRGTKKREKLRQPRKMFCGFYKNYDFHVKFWEILKKHHFAPSQNVGIPCKILCIFKSAPPFSRAPLHFNEINGFLAKRAVVGQKKALLGPKCAFLGPLRKTLYKHKLLGVFLEARNRKMRFGPEKLGVSLQNRIFVKKAFCAQKV